MLARRALRISIVNSRVPGVLDLTIISSDFTGLTLRTLIINS
jgi:hypothetical protein